MTRAPRSLGRGGGGWRGKRAPRVGPGLRTRCAHIHPTGNRPATPPQHGSESQAVLGMVQSFADAKNNHQHRDPPPHTQLPLLWGAIILAFFNGRQQPSQQLRFRELGSGPIGVAGFADSTELKGKAVPSQNSPSAAVSEQQEAEGVQQEHQRGCDPEIRLRRHHRALVLVLREELCGRAPGRGCRFSNMAQRVSW